MRKYILIFFSLLGLIDVASSTPDLIVDISEITYKTLDNQFILIKSNEQRNLVELSYGRKMSMKSSLPRNIISRILNLDMYSVMVTSSVGIMKEGKLIYEDIKYVYLKFESYVCNDNLDQEAKIINGDFELKATYENAKYKGAVIRNYSTGRTVAEF